MKTGRLFASLWTLLLLYGCGGGGGGGSTPPAPPVNPPPVTSSDPMPAATFRDASATLPASRTDQCFDARAFDADGDTDLDLIVAGFSQNGTRNPLLLNDGTGVFTDAGDTALPANSGISEHVAIGDYDTDGDLDIVIANVNNSASEMHEYYLNTGSGANFDSANPGLPVAGRSAFVVARDFDTDNDLDLFIANFGLSELLINDGFGVFTDDSAARLPGNDPQISEDSGIGDVNGDGFDDILLAYRGSTSAGQGLQNRLWLNDGLGVFTDVTATSLPSIEDSTFDIHLADVDNDGDLDALIANATIGPPNSPLRDALWINDGNGLFSDETTARWPQPVLTNSYGITTTDLDGDGDLDILVAENLGDFDTGTVRAYANDGSGTFSEQTATLLGDVQGNIVHIEAADFNADGLTDLYFCAASNFGTADSGRDFLFIGQ